MTGLHLQLYAYAVIEQLAEMIYPVLGAFQFLFIAFPIEQGNSLRLFCARDAGKRRSLLVLQGINNL